MRLDGAVVLLTGASSGIGAATAQLMAARGARLLVSGRDVAALDRIAQACDAVALPADLANPAQCDELASCAEAVHGRVDVVVLNAGIGWAGPFHEMPDAAIRSLVDVNLNAPMILSRALLPGMLKRESGHVALVGSIAGLTGVAHEAVYAATKAGLSIFAESLRLECAGRSVGVSLIVPGVVDTPFFARRGTPYTRRTPRPVTPQLVAKTLVRAIERDRAQVVVPRWLSLAQAARVLSPSVYRLLAQRFGRP